jgi:phosphoribosylanthranilate isomerase
MAHVKVCGITRLEDAELALAAGASAIGLNFIPASPRRVTAEVARRITDALRGKVLFVGVVANETTEALTKLKAAAGLDCLQLHGDEPPEALEPFLPHAYKAVRIATEADVALARTYPGEHILVDAKVEGALGGTGHTFDWTLVRDLAAERKLTLAGGLNPGNVATAVALVRPFCVDVASGVESAPGIKDPSKMIEFVKRARSL